MTAFACYYDPDGNLTVTDGVVMQPRSGVTVQVGSGLVFASGPAGEAPGNLQAVRPAAGATFVGGSARNLVLTGLPAATPAVPMPSGFFRPTIPAYYGQGIFTLAVTGASAATIHDGTNTVAILSTGGTAPVGSYASTTYGATTYHAGVAFTLTAVAEAGAPGAIPAARVTLSGGVAVGGIYDAVDAAHYTSAVSADWTLVLDPSGSAELRHLTDVIATRSAGSGYDPSGSYEPTTTGAANYSSRVTLPPWGGVIGTVPSGNPFGVLTILYDWSGSPDLDSGTTFAGVTVGYGHASSSPYMTWTGDNTSTGPETVVIDLAAAYTAGAISDHGEILCAADWYPPAGGSGPATIDLSYTVGGVTQSYPAVPGAVTPSTTAQLALRVSADGSITAGQDAWRAFVQVEGRLPRAGYVYLQIEEVASVLTAATGPFFATTLPSDTATVFHFPIAYCDGYHIEQWHVGSLVWDKKPAAIYSSGLAWIPITIAAYNALSSGDRADASKIYDITDFVW